MQNNIGWEIMNTLTTNTTLMVALLSCAILQGMNNSGRETKINAADSKSREEQTINL
jgi:hypothetical protein